MCCADDRLKHSRQVLDHLISAVHRCFVASDSAGFCLVAEMLATRNRKFHQITQQPLMMQICAGVGMQTGRFWLFTSIFHLQHAVPHTSDPRMHAQMTYNVHARIGCNALASQTVVRRCETTRSKGSGPVVGLRPARARLFLSDIA